MALLIYKQWHRNANRSGTASSNASHVRYVGERVHVLKKYGAENGLFGKFGGKPFSDEIATKAAEEYVKKMSEDGKTTFRSCISFTPERAALLELDSLEKWEKFVKYNVYTIAKNNGIGMKDFEYLAAVHNKKENPHVHIMFWNKNQQIGINYIDPEKCKEIRDDLETKVYGDLAEEIGDESVLDAFTKNTDYAADNSDKIRKELITKVFSNERAALFDIQNKLKEQLFSGTDKAAEKITEFWNYPKLSEMLYEICEAVPAQGRLSYGYMPQDVKNRIDDMSDEIMKTFPELRELFDGILEEKRCMAEMYNSTETSYGKLQIATAVGKEKDKLFTKMGNKILKAVRAYRIEQRIKQSAEYQEKNQYLQTIRRHEQAAALILSIGKLLEQQMSQARNESPPSAKFAFGRGDLSKEARLELMYENKDKGTEHGR